MTIKTSTMQDNAPKVSVIGNNTQGSNTTFLKTPLEIHELEARNLTSTTRGLRNAHHLDD